MIENNTEIASDILGSFMDAWKWNMQNVIKW